MFRKLVEATKPIYTRAQRRHKPEIAKGLVAKWKALDPPGRFLSKSGQLWFEIDDESAKKRASKSLGERSKDGSISPSLPRLVSTSSSGSSTSTFSRPRGFKGAMPKWPELSVTQTAVMENGEEEVTSDRFRLYFNSDASKTDPFKGMLSIHPSSSQDVPTNELMLASSAIIGYNGRTSREETMNQALSTFGQQQKTNLPGGVPGSEGSGDDLPTAAELASFFDGFSEQQDGQSRWLSKANCSWSNQERLMEAANCSWSNQERLMEAEQPEVRHHLSDGEGIRLMGI